MWASGLKLFFFIWIFSCPITICWKHCSFSIELSWNHCQSQLIKNMYFPPHSSLHWSVYLAFMLILHCLDYHNIVVNFEIEEVLQLCSLSKLFLLFWVTCISIWISGSACQFLKNSWDSHRDCLNFVDQFGEYCIFTILSFLFHEYGYFSIYLDLL